MDKKRKAENETRVAPMDPDKPVRVLLVEDEPRLRDMLLRAIPDMGFEAVGAKNAEEAERLMTADPREMLILDLNLPGKSGMEFFETVREKWPRTAVIILTGFGDLESAKKAIHLDVIDFLTKPCLLSDLEVALERARKKIQATEAAQNAEKIGPAALASIAAAVKEDLHRDDQPDGGADADGTDANGESQPPRKLDDLEREHILAALARNDGNRTATAAELGISLRTLYYRLSEYQQQGFLP